MITTSSQLAARFPAPLEGSRWTVHVLHAADAHAVRRQAARFAAEDAGLVLHEGAGETGFVVQDALGTVHYLGTSAEDVLRALAAFRIGTRRPLTRR